MSNLFNMKCPHCGAEDQIDVAITGWVRLTPDGSDPAAAEDSESYFDTDSEAICWACRKCGTVSDFMPELSERPTPQDGIVTKLVRLLHCCELYGLDPDFLMNEARVAVPHSATNQLTPAGCRAGDGEG